jgi:N-acetylglucosamine-6-sulfatase
MGRNSGDSFRSKRVLLVGLVCAVAFLVVGCFATASAQEAQTPPNIVFVLTDDLDYASTLRMPTISSLASEGASFENAYNSYPLCCPSRTTILTGLYAHNHGVKSNSPNWGGGDDL